jgi:multisubunit Na+/H+ antiporter MnhF subunit
MSIVWVLGFSIGAVIGLRRTNVVCFVPIAAFVAISTILIIRHPTLSEVILALSLLEIAYLAGVIAVSGGWYLLQKVLRMRGKLQLSGSLHALRTAIARELDAALEPPKEMPDKLARLVAQAQSA